MRLVWNCGLTKLEVLHYNYRNYARCHQQSQRLKRALSEFTYKSAFRNIQWNLIHQIYIHYFTVSTRMKLEMLPTHNYAKEYSSCTAGNSEISLVLLWNRNAMQQQSMSSLPCIMFCSNDLTRFTEVEVEWDEYSWIDEPTAYWSLFRQHFVSLDS